MQPDRLHDVARDIRDAAEQPVSAEQMLAFADRVDALAQAILDLHRKQAQWHREATGHYRRTLEAVASALRRN